MFMRLSLPLALPASGSGAAAALMYAPAALMYAPAALVCACCTRVYACFCLCQHLWRTLGPPGHPTAVSFTTIAIDTNTTNTTNTTPNHHQYDQQQ
mmetsp:Transcript_31604/g.94224  ORF Transcript_31604/g.94224 Transcript_31604/m.94224 type:complete len:96 (+) Transcript_31604:377-664(+)